MKTYTPELAKSLYERLGSVHKVGAVLGLSGDTIHQRLLKAGYKFKNRTWTPAEIDSLVNYYSETPDSEFDLHVIAARLDRPYAGVALKASRLKLSKPDRKWTARQKAGATGKPRWTDEKPHPRGMLGKSHTPEAVARMVKTRSKSVPIDRLAGIGRFSQEQRQLSSDRMSKRQHTDKRLRKGNNNRHKQGRRKDLGNTHFRSSWEANYARYLNQLILDGKIHSWDFEPDTFWFPAIKRGVRSYTPDFKVWTLDSNRPFYYVEVKGWMDQKSRTKIKRMAKYHPAIDLEVFDQKQYKILSDRYSRILPGWEHPGGQQNPIDTQQDEDDDLGASEARPEAD